MSFLGTFETSINTFLATVASAGTGIVGIFQAAFIAGFSIWIMLIAYDVAYGKSEDGLAYLMKKIFRVFIIGVIALFSWPELANLLVGVKDAFIVSLSGGPSIATILDTSLITPLNKLATALWNWPTTGITTLDLLVPATLLKKIVYWVFLWLVFIVLVLAVTVICIVSLAMFLVALAAFSLLMAVGPFFLLCLAFPILQRFFETYIGNVLTAILGMAFTALLVTVVGGLLDINSIAASLTSTTSYTTFGPIASLMTAKIGSALLLSYMFFKVFDLASALGGGLNMGNNMIGGVRNIVNDMQRASVRNNRSTPAPTPSGNNQIAQGKSAPAKQGGSQQSSARQISGGNRTSAMQRIAQHRTLTGAAITAGTLGVGAGGRGAINIGRTAINAAKRLVPRKQLKGA